GYGGRAAGQGRPFPQRDRRRRGGQADPGRGPIRQSGGAVRASPARGQALAAVLTGPLAPVMTGSPATGSSRVLASVFREYRQRTATSARHWEQAPKLLPA